MLRNAAINTVEGNSATLQQYIGTNEVCRHTTHTHTSAAIFVHMPLEAPLGRDLVSLGKE